MMTFYGLEGGLSISLKDTSDRVRKRSQEMREEVRGTIASIGQSLPRPLMERRTLLFKQPLIANLRERMLRGRNKLK